MLGTGPVPNLTVLHNVVCAKPSVQSSLSFFPLLRGISRRWTGETHPIVLSCMRNSPSGAKGRPGAGQGGAVQMLLCKTETRHGPGLPDRQHLLPAHRPDKAPSPYTTPREASSAERSRQVAERL